MHNPNEDQPFVPFNHSHFNHKDRKGSELGSDKSEAQESLWLLRELFPGYMERYHEDYVNNHLNTQHHHQPVQQSSAADIHTSQYTMDLSFHSVEGSRCYLDS